ncbi:hypothetical protein ACKWRH_25300 [Bradyrhizobium sp. Pa8]|uniref:hypothetical protein n=1 Tax=Bradyrhizobium sp. Pa8 TaxID=3386552 RepID=UPI00403F8B5C
MSIVPKDNSRQRQTSLNFWNQWPNTPIETIAGSPPSWWSGPDQLKDVEAFNREVHTLVRAYLESHRKEMRKIDLDIATFVCVSAIEAVAHNTVLNHAEMLSEKTVRTLVDETTRMVVGYLR